MRHETLALNRHVVELVEPGHGERVLDIGTGNGMSLRSIAERTGDGLAVGVDHSAIMCRRATRINADLIAAGRARVCCTASDAIPFEVAFFDAALSVHTLYFWDPAEPHLREIARVLRPGGRFVLVFRPAGAPGTSDFPAAVYRFRSLPEVEGLLLACGFDVTEIIRPVMGDESIALLCATRNYSEP
jgi:SAM-dependent methyltransferase